MELFALSASTAAAAGTAAAGGSAAATGATLGAAGAGAGAGMGLSAGTFGGIGSGLMAGGAGTGLGAGVTGGGLLSGGGLGLTAPAGSMAAMGGAGMGLMAPSTAALGAGLSQPLGSSLLSAAPAAANWGQMLGGANVASQMMRPQPASGDKNVTATTPRQLQAPGNQASILSAAPYNPANLPQTQAAKLAQLMQQIQMHSFRG